MRMQQVGNQWLIMACDHHGTAIKLSLQNPAVFLTVPQGATVHINVIVLYHLNLDRYDLEIQIIDTFVIHSFTISKSNSSLKELNFRLKFSLKPTGFSHTNRSSYQDHSISISSSWVHA